MLMTGKKLISYEQARPATLLPHRRRPARELYIMVRIITDSSTLHSVKQGEALGIDVSMLSVTINNKTYRELEEFIDLINQGHIPTSSQPSIGEVLALYNKYPQDELLNITIADGLSGTYQTALSAAGMAHDPGRITVLNSRTLCGPHRYLVSKAIELAKGGKAVKAIVAELEKLIATSRSFLIPQDFDYLRRGGRLSSIVARIGKLIKLAPVMTLTEDSKQMTRFSIQRSFRRAVQTIVEELQRLGVDHTCQISISHSMAEDLLHTARELVARAFPSTEILTYLLSPAFTVQGGPRCIAIQTIRKRDFS
jgi:DegV family protein with EDD domain